MSTIYSGTGWSKTAIGEYDNGTVYSGTGWSKTAIGEYDNGTVYSGTGWSKTAIGEYDDGTIYSGTGWSKTAIGEYDNGTIYNGTGWGKTAVGEYEGSPAGAAAFLLLDFNSSSGGGSFGSSSETGCLSAIFALLWGIISFLFVVVIPFYFVYFLAPSYLGFSWVGLLCAVLSILFVSTGIVPLAIPFILAFSIIEILFGIYWVLVIIIKIKTHCTRMDVLKLFGKWFLKGPFAYVDLLNQLNETNTAPKVASLLGKIIEWFKKVFKKKESH